ncbi:MAG: stage II sporulation protein M [Lachnospiraceae bacterium]|nr:stage II sporulation protein M [Lachnospiraceae bacterium]
MRYPGKDSGVSVSRKFLLFFMTGFIPGVLFACMTGKQYMEYAGIISEYYMNRYKYMEIVKEQLFLYLMKERMVPMLFLLLMSLTAYGKAAVYLALLWMGISFGILWTLSVLKFGAVGFLICAAGMLPQYLFYVPAFLMLAFQIRRGAIYEVLRSGRYAGMQKGAFVGNVLQYFVVFILLVAGIILETWVSPELLKLVLKIL